MTTEKQDILLLKKLQDLQWALFLFMRDNVLTKSVDELSSVAHEGEDDTIYSIDVDTENFISDYFEKNIKKEITCRLIAEGFPTGGVVFGNGASDYTVIMDPLDGTRGLMYGKRNAWTLAAAARGDDETLTFRDIIIAVQTEIASPKQDSADQLWAVKNGVAAGLRKNIVFGKESELLLRPSKVASLKYGFASFVRFFPGTKELVTQIESEFVSALEAAGHDTFYFEDQYICSGGQLAGLITGADRFVCDLRGVLGPVLQAAGKTPPLCAHPYDLCTELIARQAGVIVTDPMGNPLSAPLDTTTNVSWIGYSNNSLQKIIEPVLLKIIAEHCNI